MTGTVYLSGPITGQNYHDARFGWRRDFALKMPYGITVLSPMRHEGHLSEIKGPLEKVYPENLFSHPHLIVAKDFLDIDLSDVVVANLRGATRISVGTLVELGYAKAKGKAIVTIMSPDDIHEHPFVREISAVVIDNVPDAAQIVTSLLSTGV